MQQQMVVGDCRDRLSELESATTTLLAGVTVRCTTRCATGELGSATTASLAGVTVRCTTSCATGGSWFCA
ncbi:hypothetical protein ACFX2B_023456 [Malus domestica]